MDVNLTQIIAQYGVTGIPSTFLLDKDGKILKKDLRGPDVVTEVAGALQSH